MVMSHNTRKITKSYKYEEPRQSIVFRSGLQHIYNKTKSKRKQSKRIINQNSIKSQKNCKKPKKAESKRNPRKRPTKKCKQVVNSSNDSNIPHVSEQIESNDLFNTNDTELETLMASMPDFIDIYQDIKDEFDSVYDYLCDESIAIKL